MNTTPLVSVIIPCFNSGKTLSRTLNSLESQTYFNIEIIIVNDGSNEISTIKALQEFSKNQTINIIDQENLGLSAARNKGISSAKGEYIIPLDADDWLEPEAIKLMVSSILLKSSKSIVYSDIYLHGDRTGIKKTFCNPFEQLFSNQLPYCMLFPKSVLMELGGYDQDFKIGFEDWELNLRLFQNHCSFYKINKPVFNYSVSNNGMLKAKSLPNFAYILGKIRKKNISRFKFSKLLVQYKNAIQIASNRPIFVYFLFDIAFRIFPDQIINMLLRLMLTVQREK